MQAASPAPIRASKDAAGQSATPTSFKCQTCGKEHPFSVWVYGHMDERLKHKCECGAEHAIYRLRANQTRPGRKPMAAAEAAGASL